MTEYEIDDNVFDIFNDEEELDAYMLVSRHTAPHALTNNLRNSF